jgi:Fe-S oxidoreductase
MAGLLPYRQLGQADAEPLRATFHDPCYLGRHNKDYLTARAVLGALPGLELLEMDRAMGDALCCGGGGGNFFTDVLGGGADSSCRVRVREAAETGAQVLAVACPKCAKMFEDAIKVENLEGELRVMDIAEIVEERAA